MVDARLIGQYDDRQRRFPPLVVRNADDRITVAGDILNFDDLFVDDAQLTYDEKTFKKRLTDAPESVELLRGYRLLIEDAEPFEAANLEQVLKSFLEQRGAKIGMVIHALRVAVTGKSAGFGMFETLEILGRQRCLSRIDRSLEQVVQS